MSDELIAKLDELKSAIVAARRCQRSGYGFEIKKDFYRAAVEWLERESRQTEMFAA